MGTIGEVTIEKEGCFTWDIPNLREVWDKFLCFYTPNFNYMGRKYYLALQKGTNAKITLWLYCANPTSPRLSIECQLRTEKHIATHIHAITIRHASGYARTTIDFKDFLSKELGKPLHDCLIVFFWDVDENGSGMLPVIYQKVITEGPKRLSRQRTDPDYESLKKLQKDLEKLLLNKEDSDITLEVQGVKFPAHKNILKSRSPVFNAMLNHKMKEANSGVIVIEDSDPESFPDFLRYLYTGSIRHISEENVCELFTISDKYEVMELKSKCAEFMKDHMTVKAFCEFYALAHLYSEEELITSAVEFFCDHAVRIAKTENWKLLLKENWVICNDLYLEALSRGKDI